MHSFAINMQYLFFFFLHLDCAVTIIMCILLIMLVVCMLVCGGPSILPPCTHAGRHTRAHTHTGREMCTHTTQRESDMYTQVRNVHTHSQECTYDTNIYRCGQLCYNIMLSRQTTCND